MFDMVLPLLTKFGIVDDCFEIVAFFFKKTSFYTCRFTTVVEYRYKILIQTFQTNGCVYFYFVFDTNFARG